MTWRKDKGGLSSGATYFIPSPPATGNTSTAVCPSSLCGKALRAPFQDSMSCPPPTVQTTPPPDLQMFLEHMFLVVPFLVQSSPVRCATWCHGSECLFLPRLCYYSASSFVLRGWHLRATIKAFMKLCILLSCYASAWFGGRREGCLQVPLQPARSIECCTNCD